MIDRLRADGPLTATELGGAKNGGQWWDWSGAKIAVEWLLIYGEVVCVERRGWRRVYDLAERAVPAELLHDDRTTRSACAGWSARRAGRWASPPAPTSPTTTGSRASRSTRWSRDPGWCRSRSRAGPSPPGPTRRRSPRSPRGRHRTTLLSPFDSLIWDRPRTERIFGFTHRLEAYVPKPKRVHGYFAMPLLAGGRLLGRVDPAREGRTLVARQVSLEAPKAVAPMAHALREAAGWVGCDGVRVERVDAPELRRSRSRGRGR